MTVSVREAPQTVQVMLKLAKNYKLGGTKFRKEDDSGRPIVYTVKASVWNNMLKHKLDESGNRHFGLAIAGKPVPEPEPEPEVVEAAVVIDATAPIVAEVKEEREETDPNVLSADVVVDPEGTTTPLPKKRKDKSKRLKV